MTWFLKVEIMEFVILCMWTCCIKQKNLISSVISTVIWVSVGQTPVIMQDRNHESIWYLASECIVSSRCYCFWWRLKVIWLHQRSNTENFVNTFPACRGTFQDRRIGVFYVVYDCLTSCKRTLQMARYESWKLDT